MLVSEVNQILIECDRFAKLIEHENRLTKKLLENPNEKDIADIDMIIRSNKQLIRFTEDRLEQLSSTLEHVGWYRKKVVNSYIERIRIGFLLSQDLILMLTIVRGRLFPSNT